MKSLSLVEPYIIAMVGVPGAGKTRFALQFAETFSAPFINDRPLRIISRNPDDGSEVALEILKQVLRTRQTTLFEGETGKRVDRETLVKLAKESGYKVLFVWVQADPGAAEQRAMKNGVSEEDNHRRIKEFSPPHESEPYVVISGHHTHATQTRAVLLRLTETRAKVAAKVAATPRQPRQLSPQTRK